jgi:hypothetical protein
MSEQRAPLRPPDEQRPVLRSDPEVLRAALLRDPHNRELRLAYLARRPPRLAEADFRAAALALALARAVKVVLGFTAFGLLGGVAAWGIVCASGQPPRGSVGVAVLVGTGSALLGAVSFAALAVVGPVALEDLFVPYQSGTDRARAARSALGRRFASAGALLIDVVGGALWGAVCGVCVGVLGSVAGTDRLLGAGTVGGLLLGGVLAVGVLLQRRANPRLPPWVELGPLPWPAYWQTVAAARRTYRPPAV